MRGQWEVEHGKCLLLHREVQEEKYAELFCVFPEESGPASVGDER